MRRLIRNLKKLGAGVLEEGEVPTFYSGNARCSELASKNKMKKVHFEPYLSFAQVRALILRIGSSTS